MTSNEENVTRVLPESDRDDMNQTIYKVMIGSVTDELVNVVEEIVRRASAMAFEEGEKAGRRAAFNDATSPGRDGQVHNEYAASED